MVLVLLGFCGSGRVVGDSSLCLLFAHLEADVVQKSKGTKALKDESPDSHDLAEEPPRPALTIFVCHSQRPQRICTRLSSDLFILDRVVANGDTEVKELTSSSRWPVT